MHLPHVRFRPLPLRLDQKHYPFDLHAWVKTTANCTIGLSKTARQVPKAVRVCSLESNYSVMSKRKLLSLRRGACRRLGRPSHVHVVGLRRRGYTPASIRDFADRIGVAKANSTVDVGILEYCIRDDLNRAAPRVMAVLDPIRVVIENYPEDQEEKIEAPYWPSDDPRAETRMLPFSREIFIEREDFMENPSKKYFRLAPGREVRLRYAYLIKCVCRENKRERWLKSAAVTTPRAAMAKPGGA